jgi:ParB-like chromosome segregation protein Spo0J
MIYKIHPAARLFPTIGGKEFDDLKADIAAHGIKVPILVNKKKDTILDGRNRIMAADDLGLKDSEVPIEVFNGSDEEVVPEIISRNVMRRHLTDDQRVAIVAKLLEPQLTKEAEEREKAGKAVNPVFKSTQGRSWRQVAFKADVGQHKARSALTLAKHAPKDLDNVIEGKEKLAAAHKKARAKARATAKPKPQKSLRERVETKFLKMMESFAVTEYQAVREILRELLAIGAR